jgi:hypothetical protein
LTVTDTGTLTTDRLATLAVTVKVETPDGKPVTVMDVPLTVTDPVGAAADIVTRPGMFTGNAVNVKVCPAHNTVLPVMEMPAGGAGLTFSANEVLTDPLAGSLAVTVTEKAPLTVGEPEITPVVGLMVTPEGKPVAEYASIPPSGSLKAAAVVVLNATPTVADWGVVMGVAVSMGGMLAGTTIRVNPELTLKPSGSVTRTVTV